MVEDGSLVSYEEGINLGYDKPKSFYNKVLDVFKYGELTELEDKILRGIELMKIDQLCQKDCRGG